MTLSYRCHCCGELHQGIPDLAMGPPVDVDALPAAERDNSTFTDDWCEVNDEAWFVRGCLELPIQGVDEKFAYGVWVSLSRKSFLRAMEIWNDDANTHEPPFFGWLMSSLPGYPDTLHLKTHVHLRGRSARPAIELEPTDHPLAVEQREGITTERLSRILAPFLHREQDA